MEQITACFLTTTFAHREAIAKEAIDALDAAIDPVLVTNKIAAVDHPRYAKLGDMAYKARLNGWKTIEKKLRPSMQAQFDLIEAAYSLPGDWILYCEDDVLVRRLPKSEEFSTLLEMAKLQFGRKVGMFSLMHGGFSRGEETKQAHADWLNNWKNWRHLYESKTGLDKPDSCLLLRSDELRDAHFFEFPVTIVRKDIFLSCNLWAQKNRKGVHSETALTDAWFTLGFDKEYCKVSWFKSPLDSKNNPENKEPEQLWSFNDYDSFILQDLLFVESFGNSPRLRQVPVTGGISMAF